MRPAAGAATGAPPAGAGLPDLGRRTLTILWGLPIVAACVWLGGFVLAGAVAVLTLVGLREFQALGRPFGAPRALRPEAVTAALVVLAGAALGSHLSLALTLGLVLVVVGGVVRAAAARGGEALRGALCGTLWAMLALLYIPWLLGYALLLRGSAPGPAGAARALVLVGAVWCGDVAAFLVGSRFGRHRLAAGISPGKTVEGALIAVAVAALLAAVLAGPLALPVWAAACAGAAIGGAGLAGDLWESLLKRGAEVKDSGGGVPGHGGVLDRFDSLLLAAPVAYWLLARVPWPQLPALWR